MKIKKAAELCQSAVAAYNSYIMSLTELCNRWRIERDIITHLDTPGNL